MPNGAPTVIPTLRPQNDPIPQSIPQSTTTLNIPATVEPDWRDMPIMPEISGRILEIYRDGKAQGRNPHALSVIGDCQAIPFVFLGPFERGEQAPAPSEAYLWDVLQYYKGSFNRSGMAVRGGFNAASVMSPIQADPQYCLAGETPLTCEFRLQNPSVAFIMLETWIDPNTIDRYEGILREIMDYVIDKGTIPILMTKADVSELKSGIHVINPAIVRVARDYDVPLINFWRSAQYLENRGIDPNREGLHLSPEGYKLKNILALRTLYNMWKDLKDNGLLDGLPAEPTATPTLEPTPTTLPSIDFTKPDCNGGCIFFGSAISRDGATSAHGVYALNFETKVLAQILGDGFDLQDVSEDGARLLVNRGSSLYEINLDDSTSRLISAAFFSFGKQGAYWNKDDSRIIFLDSNNPIKVGNDQAVNLFPSTRDGEMYFDVGACVQKAACTTNGVYRMRNVQDIEQLEHYAKLVFSPNGQYMAFLDPSQATEENYFHISTMLFEEVEHGLASRRLFYFPAVAGFRVHPEVRGYSFSADNNFLYILYDVYSDYFERSLRLQTFVYDIRYRVLLEYGQVEGVGGSLLPQSIWSPDGSRVLLFFTTVTADNFYSMSVYETNLKTGERHIAFLQDWLIEKDYFYITNIYWR